MIAAPTVPKMQASGTLRFGFSTAPEACAADSSPRKAHSVSEMLELMPANRVRPFGFHAAAKVSPLNQSHPAIERNPTGRITPQTLTAPMRPVSPGPPKFAIVVSHSNPMTPMVVAMGVADSDGKKAERYPTAELATATFAMASD